jgi:hypothetical protein
MTLTDTHRHSWAHSVFCATGETTGWLAGRTDTCSPDAAGTPNGTETGCHEAGGWLLGIISERDLLLKVAGHDEALAAPASAYMTADPETVRGSDTLAFALHKMDCGGYRHLVVLREGQPPDMISVRDMILHITRLCRNGG